MCVESVERMERSDATGKGEAKGEGDSCLGVMPTLLSRYGLFLKVHFGD